VDFSIPQRLHKMPIQLLGNDIKEKKMSSERPRKVSLKYAFRSRLHYICCNIIVSDDDVLASFAIYQRERDTRSFFPNTAGCGV